MKENWKEGLSEWQQIVLDPLYPVVILLHDGPAAGVENPFERVIVADIVRCFYERMLPFEQQGRTDSGGLLAGTNGRNYTPPRPECGSAISLLEEILGCRTAWLKPWTAFRAKNGMRSSLAYTVADTEFAQAEGEFLFSRNRLNVTTSRARRKLVFIVSRRLFEVVPPREEVIDAAQTLRRFVFGAERVEGEILLPDTEGREWPVEVRVRRFEAGPLPPPLQGATRARGIQALPLLTESLQDLERIIRKIALISKYGNAPHYEINRQALRDVAFAELRDLLILGRITWANSVPRHSGQQHPLIPRGSHTNSIQIV